LEHTLTTGSEFSPEHICGPADEVAAYYAGDLYVPKTRYRYVVLYALDAQCIEIVKKNLPIYARPFTDEGKTVMENRGFVTFPEGSPNLEMRKLSKLDPRFATSSPFDLRHHRKRKVRREAAT
jgi:hypothetical protein